MEIWNGAGPSRGETKTLSATVKSTKLGSFQIEANAVWLVANPPGAGGAKSLFITVSEKGATVSDQIPTASTTFVTPASPRTPYPFESPMTTIPIPTGPQTTPTPSVDRQR